MASTMMTREEKDIGCQIHWYLPATFSQFILEMDTKIETLRKYYQEEYMEMVDEGLRKAKFLQDMLQDNSFYKYETPFRPQISEFEFVDTLKTGEQTSGSGDCGVWVATWMINYRKTYNYTISVDDGTRMRLALD
ncbi:hypothetical protein PIB30_090209 [Stylosanthes scabra]|uniref:Ubiquitin-like protease family profile domain-containing protein n=1 Tax=Stylosanthes scabra TaxID=79078 RepID=A0ABU6TTT8_9FABA|nr:hypothetical protein [Stylosanthes scabra]